MHLRDCFICKSPSPEVSRLRVSRACFTSRNLAQEGNILYKCLMFFFRFEVARNDHVELQASIFTFLSHSPRPWRAHGGVWSQMLTGWAASGCKEDWSLCLRISAESYAQPVFRIRETTKTFFDEMGLMAAQVYGACPLNDNAFLGFTPESNEKKSARNLEERIPSPMSSRSCQTGMSTS